MTCWSRLRPDESERESDTYPIPRVPGTVTSFARLMTRWHFALPRSPLHLSPSSVSSLLSDGSIQRSHKVSLRVKSFTFCQLIASLDCECVGIFKHKRGSLLKDILLNYFRYRRVKAFKKDLEDVLQYANLLYQ